MTYVGNEEHQRQNQNKCWGNPDERATQRALTEEAALDLACQGDLAFQQVEMVSYR